MASIDGLTSRLYGEQGHDEMAFLLLQRAVRTIAQAVRQQKGKVKPTTR